MGKFMLLSNMGNGHYKELSSLVGKENFKIAYVPSRSDFGHEYFQKVVDRYSLYGITEYVYFDIDREYDSSKISAVMNSDVIFLAGGNEGFFLKNIISRNFIQLISKFIKKGGTVVGLCAGATLLTQDIVIAYYYGRRNESLKTLNYGLGFLDFVFYPRFDNNFDMDSLYKYSIQKKRTLYLCNLECGIIIDKNKVTPIGQITKVEYGKLSILSKK